MIRLVTLSVCALLPAGLKLLIYRRFFGYEIGKEVRIGISLINVQDCKIHDGAAIGHFNIFSGMESLVIGKNSIVGNLNRISGTPKSNRSAFSTDGQRRVSFIMGCESAITSRHFFDVQDRVEIGDFTTFAGMGTQVWTHGIDVLTCRQRANAVTIGSYVYIGANVTFLAGSEIPDKCVVGSCSLITGKFNECEALYAGNPAILKKRYVEAAYFSRKTGYVN